MSSNGYCPHGHPVAEITLANGMKQAVHGHVSNHPVIPDGPCPLCVQTDWKGLAYVPEPPKPVPATFVTNPEQK